MSGQLLELIIFAGVAIFLVSKLMNILGTTSEDDPTNNNKYGNSGTFYSKRLRIIESEAKDNPSLRNILNEKFSKKSIVAKNKKDVLKGLKELTGRIPNFSIDNFLKGAKAAFRMIIEAGANENEEELAELVDMRYIEHFKEMAPSYGSFENTNESIKAEISEIYMFGNNAFIKVLFVGKDITTKVKSMHEEWTFTRNTLAEGPAWQLTNIDRPQ